MVNLLLSSRADAAARGSTPFTHALDRLDHVRRPVGRLHLTEDNLGDFEGAGLQPVRMIPSWSCFLHI